MKNRKLYNLSTLPNGLRVIHRPSSSGVIFCGFSIAAGTRHEPQGYEGLAHFCEHVSFKGTARRSSLQVGNYLERVGGDLNAFTVKEGTTFYAAMMKDYLPRAIDLLSDIVFHSTFPQSEIDKEVEVICDEIESYNDSPMELIYDEFENILFDSHPLGHNVLGNAERVRQFTSADAQMFTQRYYTPMNSVFFIDGDVDFNQVMRLLEKHTADVQTMFVSQQSSSDPATVPLPEQAAATIIRQKGTHQAHVMTGCRTFPYEDARRLPLYLLNNILGGPGMNARLNVSLREKNGLVYTVESTMVNYTDTGMWCTYFGCDPHDVKRCRRLVMRELDKLMQHPLTPRQLSAVKQQLKGQIWIACDNRENFAIDFGRSYLYRGQERDIALFCEQIDAITSQQLLEVAQQTFAPNRLSTLIYT